MMVTHSLTKLSINKAIFYAYHGVNKAEKELGGRYEVDVDLYYDATPAILADNVNYAINYEEVLYDISEIIQSEDYDLVETVTNEILNALMDKYDILQKITVRLRKLHVPIHRYIDHIEVEQSIDRIKNNNI